MDDVLFNASLELIHQDVELFFFTVKPRYANAAAQFELHLQVQ